MNPGGSEAEGGIHLTRWHETELKLALPDVAAWERVRNRIAPSRVVRQVNHFFDGPGRPLRSARIGVRLRSSGGRILLTVKADTGASDSVVTRRIELEEERPPESLGEALDRGLDLRDAIARWRARACAAPDPDPPLVDLLDRLRRATVDGPLRTFGSFENERTIGTLTLADAGGTFVVPIELDRTTLPGNRVDYEVEVEADPTSENAPDLARTHRALAAWLEREIGARGFARESKLARFEAALEAGETGSHQAEADLRLRDQP